MIRKQFLYYSNIPACYLGGLLIVLLLSVGVVQGQSVLSTGDFYKLGIPEDGVYKIDYDFLRSLGIDFTNFDLRSVKIYGNGGGMLPQRNDAFRYKDLIENAIYVEGEEEGVFDAEDYILFYAEGPDRTMYDIQQEIFRVEKNLYADTNYYFLAITEGVGKRMSSQPNIPTGWAPLITHYNHYHYHEMDAINIVGSGRYWYGEKFSEEQASHQFSIPTQYLLPNTEIKLTTSVISTANQPSTFGFALNGYPIGEVEVNGAQPSVYGYKAREKSAVLSGNTNGLEGQETLELDISFQNSTGHSGYLDYFLINSQNELVFSGEALAFRSLESTENYISTFQIESETASVHLWDITDPLVAKRQSFEQDGGKVTFTTYTDTLKEFIVFSANDIRVPTFVEKLSNQDVQGLTPPQLLIITHPAFAQEALRLAGFRRQHDGLTVEVMSVDQIYNEFSSGRQDVTAIRDFIRHLYQKGNQLQYVLLFGDASYDYKNYREENTNYIPIYQSYNSLHNIHSYASDDYFGFMDDREGEWTENTSTDQVAHDLELGIGRLPVKSVEEARQVVDKLIRYATHEESMGAWRSKITFIADDGDLNKHQIQSDYLADYVETHYPAYNVNRIFMDVFPQEKGKGSPEVRRQIDQMMDRGSLIVDFIGHGGETAWTNENILNIPMINAWENRDHLPLFMTATCEFGRFDDPRRSSGAEVALLHPQGGAIGLLTTTRPVFPNTTFEVSRAFYEVLFEKEDGKMLRLGDVIRKTKNRSISGTTNRNFSLLGDPSMQLAYPEKTIAVTRINHTEPERLPPVAPLERVTLQGEVQENGQTDTGFEGEVEITVYDKPSQITTLGDEGPETVMTFENRQNVLFRGKATVNQGKFEVSFILPKNMEKSIGEAKISLYARHATQPEDALGASEAMQVGGEPKMVAADSQPPEIQLYLNNFSFRPGQAVSPDPVLIAQFTDESGINVTASETHGILAILEGEEIYEEFALHAYYIASADNYQKGSLIFPLRKLSLGKYQLTLLASDNHHNRAKAVIDFEIVDQATPLLAEFLVYPNPSTTFFTFRYAPQNLGNELTTTLEIYTATGQLLQTFTQNVTHSDEDIYEFQWMAQDEKGNFLPNGTYLYKFILTSSDASMHRSGKLILSQ